MSGAPDAGQLARRGLFAAFVALVVLALVVFAASQLAVSEAAVATLRQRADPVGVLLGVSGMTVGMVFLALRWRTLLPRPAEVAVLPLTGILMIGSLANYALPGPVGEFVAAGLAARRFGVAAEVAFAASVYARLLGLFSAGVVASAIYAFGGVVPAPGMAQWVAAAMVGLATVAVALGALSLRPALLEQVASWSIAGPARAPLRRLASALSSQVRLPAARWALALGWALVGHLCVIVGIFVAASALGASPSALGLVFTYAASTAGAIALFAFPGSQVGWDAMFAGLLVSVGNLELSEALATALIVRVQQIFIVCMGAVVAIVEAARPRGDERAG